MFAFAKATASALPTDEYLSPEELLQLQHRLVDHANTILDASRSTVNQLTADREADADPLDFATNETERDFSLRMAGRERQMLAKVRAALGRIAEGEYGVCQDCGDAIGFRRLLARPVARQCVDCKTQSEQLERRSRAL